MGNYMNKKFLKAIQHGNYQEANSLLCLMPKKEVSQFLIDQAIETGSVAIYAFVCFLLLEQESTELHYCAAGILDHGLCYLKGATSASLFHAKRATELSPDDITCQQELLCYFGMPDQVMSKEEAKAIAENILLKDPNSVQALKVIERIKRLD
jgi:hypothetical protein